jgi:SSU ribosomal protein S1P
MINQDEMASQEAEENVNTATNAGLENFDWESYADESLYTRDQRMELETLYNETLSTIGENEVVEGTVIGLTKREVFINIGYKSEGVVSISEFRYNSDLKVGEKVEVYVENPEDKKGQLVLSHKKARALRSWDRVNSALEKRRNY